MANGYPISAVCGVRDVMKVVEKEVFVSSTYFPNSLEAVAALKTIEILEREKALDVVRDKGTRFMRRVQKLIADSGVPAELSGIPQMPFVTFPECEGEAQKVYRKRRTLFYTEVIRRRVFLQPFHHGYICYRHTEEDLDQAVNAIAEALDVVRRDVG